MNRLLAVIVLAALLVSAGGGQTAAEKNAFLSRKKWYVSFSVSIHGSGGNDGGSWAVSRRLSGSLVMDLSNPGTWPLSDPPDTQEEALEVGRYIGWMVGPPDDEALERFNAGGNPLDFPNNPMFVPIDFSVDDTFTSQDEETTFKGNGTIYGYKGFQLLCDLKKMVFDLIPGFALAGTKTVTVTTLKREGSSPPPYEADSAQLFSGPASIGSQLMGQRLDVTRPISVTATGPMSGGFVGRGNIDLSTLTYTMRILVTPTQASTATLILEPESRYREWRPIPGESEDKAGDDLTIKWKVEEQGLPPGEKPQISKVTLRLTKVSRYPGVCMNWPATPSGQPKPDLAFPEPHRDNLDFTVKDEGLTLVIDGKAAQDGFGSITIECFDGAAIGDLVAEAEMKDGRILQTEVRGQAGSGKVLIPLRDDGVSDIAKSWRYQRANGLEDKSDEEDKPEGDGQVGDGLSVWEEYRGFRQNTVWKDNCDPKKKDLFLENRVGATAESGIHLFEKATELVIHRIKRLEHKIDRVINFNKRDDRHTVDQHCLILRVSDDPNCGTAEGIFGANFPGPPKNTLWVNVVMGLSEDQVYSMGPRGALRSGNYQAKHIAHELGHGIGIYHHGESDPWTNGKIGVPWSSRDPDGDGLHSMYEQGTLITVLDEASGGPRTWPAGANFNCVLGEKNGQHSGEVDCLMRYVTARAYRYQANSNTRIWHGQAEPPGKSLCTSRIGTDFNAGGHSPHSRYFDTDPKRGDCKHQFVISDKWEAKDRG